MHYTMKKHKFWKWIDASLDERHDWGKQLGTISEHSLKYPLKDIIAFDKWLKKLVDKTYKKLHYHSALENFYKLYNLTNGLECFVILLGSETYERVINDPSILVKKNYLKEYKSVHQVIDNLLDTPDYTFYWRTGENMSNYFDNPEALKALQKEVDKNHDKRYDY